MGKTLSELIADAAANDDVEFSIPDGTKFKLGDVRLFKAGVESEKKKFETQRAEAERVASEAKKLLETLDTAMKEEQKKQQKIEPAAGPDWKKNPLYEELVPVFDALTNQVSESKAIAAAAQKSLSQVSAFYSIERMRREYDAAPEAYRKAHPFEQVVTEALANGDSEAYGSGENVVKMPTLRKRIHEATEPDRIQAAVTDAVAKAQKEWEAKQKLNNIPKPAGRFSSKAAPTDKPPIAKLEELTSEKIMNDPDIAAAMEGTTN